MAFQTIDDRTRQCLALLLNNHSVMIEIGTLNVEISQMWKEERRNCIVMKRGLKEMQDEDERNIVIIGSRHPKAGTGGAGSQLCPSSMS